MLDSIMRDVSEAEAPGLHQTIDKLCKKLGMEKPAIRFTINTARHPPLQQFMYEHMAGR